MIIYEDLLKMNKALSIKLNTKAEIIDALTLYSKWLEEHGYIDADWWCEHPQAIPEFEKEFISYEK